MILLIWVLKLRYNTKLKFCIIEGTNMNKAPSRGYSFVCVFYGTHNELIEFLRNCKHFMYIYHSRDETDPHFHIYCTFKTQKSFNSVRSLMNSKSNLLCQFPKGSPLDNEMYFLHQTDESLKDGKYQYDIIDITFDDNLYWAKLLKDDDVEQSFNNEFFDDLLLPTMRVEDMCRKYGRDFARNAERYLFIRNLIFSEREADVRLSLRDINNADLYSGIYKII